MMLLCAISHEKKNLMRCLC